MSRKHVVVIGGGGAGVIAAAALARLPRAPHVTLIGRDGFGPGLAYSEAHKRYLLNVRAGNMSAYADKPDDFANWLKSKTGADATAFATRARYGRYLRDVLSRAERRALFGGGLKRVRDDAVACRAGSGWWEITLGSGKTLDANGVVLALGNQPPATPQIFAESDVSLIDPWNWIRLKRAPSGDILLIGAGLTMIDLAHTLSMQRRIKTIFALSRRGQIPRSHLDPPRPPPPAAPLDLPPRLSLALHLFRTETRAMAERGEPWQFAVDRLRAVTPTLWQSLPPETQQRFLRHLRVWWDVHRHRAAPEAAARTHELIMSGKLRVLAGEIVSAQRAGRCIEIYHRQRGSRVRHRLEVSAVVNCTGANGDITQSGEALIQQMLADGVARAHASGIGFDLDHDSRVLNAQGEVQGSLYAIGPATQGAFWESTAVPEIRTRAAAIAGQF